MFNHTYQKSCSQWLQVLFLAAVMLAVYGHTLDYPFHFDDRISIEENEAIRNLDDIRAIWQFSHLRFFSYFSFALNYHFHGLDVTGYHIINLLIHFLASCSVFFLVQSLLCVPSEKQSNPSAAWLPFLTALIFILHPLQTQSVTYIVQRSAALAALFYICSMACYVRLRLSNVSTQKILWGVGVFLFMFLAFFSKQNTATLPFALLLIEIVFFRKEFKRILLFPPAILLLLGAMLFCILLLFKYEPFSFDAIDSLTRETLLLSRSQYLAIQAGVVWTYIRLFFWPADQHLDYHVSIPSGLAEPTVITALACHFIVLCLAAFFIKRYPLPVFGIFFYYLAHIVESSIIPIRDIVFEHRTYLPNLGLSVVVAWLLTVILERQRKISLLIIFALMFVLGITTWQRNTVWQDQISVWRNSMIKSPGNPRPYYNLAKALETKGNYIEAEVLYRMALELKPDYESAYVNLGNLLLKKKNFKEAIYYFSLALQLAPDDAINCNNLGLSLLENGEIEKAEGYLLKAIRLNPQYAEAQNSVGLLMIMKGNLEKATEHLYITIALAPNYANGHSNLGDVLLQKGDMTKAIHHYLEALRIDPVQAEVYGNLAFAYLTIGDQDNAVTHFKKSLEINPMLAVAHNFLGKIYFNRRDFDAAIYHYRNSLDIDRNQAQATKGLELALKGKSKIKQ